METEHVNGHATTTATTETPKRARKPAARRADPIALIQSAIKAMDAEEGALRSRLAEIEAIRQKLSGTAHVTRSVIEPAAPRPPRKAAPRAPKAEAKSRAKRGSRKDAAAEALPKILNIVALSAKPMRSEEIQKATGLDKDAVAMALKAAVVDGKLTVEGQKRSASYSIPA